jgi:hypothetical protein
LKLASLLCLLQYSFAPWRQSAAPCSCWDRVVHTLVLCIKKLHRSAAAAAI